MEKNEKQLTYETPEAEAVEVRMGNSILSGCSNADTEGGSGGEGCEWD